MNIKEIDTNMLISAYSEINEYIKFLEKETETCKNN